MMADKMRTETILPNDRKKTGTEEYFEKYFFD
jgi:hypothetical protein